MVGCIGPEGTKGEQGIQGPQGIQGAIGPQGPDGATGPAGATGAAGAIGPAGTPLNFIKIATQYWYNANQTGMAYTVGASPGAICFDGTNIWVSN